MTEPQPRGSCPHCAEQAAMTALVCPHCRQSLLVDLWLSGPMPSPRDAYGAARRLETLDPQIAFSLVKRTLDAGGGVLLAGVTRDLAAHGAEVVAGHGGTSDVTPHAVVAPGGDEGRTVARRAALVALAALLVLGGAWVWRGPKGAPGEPTSRLASWGASRKALTPREVGLLASASTASVRCGTSLGSGFFVTSERLVTNAHVLCNSPDDTLVIRMSDGRELTGILERKDDWLDVALVRAPGAGVPALPLGDASTLRQGDPVFIYGSPRGLELTLSQGIVSHAARMLQGLAYVQIDANVNPGNSGGPLLSAQGEAVGIVTMVVGEGSGLGLALPVNYLYQDEAGLAEAPARADRLAWQRLVRQAREQDAQEVARVIAGMEHPALAGAYLADGRRPLAVVIRQSEREPWSEPFEFRLEGAGETLCYPRGRVEDWLQVAASDASWLDERTRRWLERHDLEVGVWAALVPLEWEGCPPAPTALGHDLVLSDADPAGRRATFEPIFLPGF